MKDLYVQFGAGFVGPEGWVNFDASPTLRVERLPIIGRLARKNGKRFPLSVQHGDIVRGLLLSDGSACAVYASHVLEHLSRRDFEAALRNTYRLLKPGGVFRLIVPDLEWRAREYVAARDRGEVFANDQFMTSAHLGRKTRSLITSLGNSLHLWMWDEPSNEGRTPSSGLYLHQALPVGR